MSPDENDKRKKLDQDDIDALLENTEGDEVDPPEADDPGEGGLSEGADEVYGGEITDEKVIEQADIDQLLEQAKAPAAGAEKKTPSKPLAASVAAEGSDNLSMLMDVSLNVRIELGKTSLSIEDILKLHDGSVVELDKLAGDPLDIVVNDRLIARGEVLVLNDNFCVRITDILDPEERLKAGIEKKT